MGCYRLGPELLGEKGQNSNTQDGRAGHPCSLQPFCTWATNGVKAAPPAGGSLETDCSVGPPRCKMNL